jgi:hypothetical protein
MSADLMIHGSARESALESRDPHRPGAVQLAEDERRHGPGVADDAGLGHHRGDLRDAADHVVGAEHARQDLGGIDPVLKGDHAGLRPEQRSDRGRGNLGIVELDREDHEIDRPDASRVVGCLGRSNGDVAARAADPEAMLRNRPEMGAPRDERDVLAGRGEAAADVGADPAAAHDRDAQ